MSCKHIVLVGILFSILIQSTIQKDVKIPIQVVKAMGSRHMRYHHFLWHNLRELWNLIDEPTQKAIGKLGWAPKRPSLEFDENLNRFPIEDNGSGEDFLYMHREMIGQVNKIAKEAGSKWRVNGWVNTPCPGDKDYPVTPIYPVPGLDQEFFATEGALQKSDKFYYETIVPTEKALKDPKKLRKLTLGQLGSMVEYTVHNWMHVRFSDSSPYGIRAQVFNPIPDMEKKWDNIKYDWLGDTYSSHVNEWFWKIHGWVDARIEDWRKANGIKTIKWKNTWVGGSLSKLDALIEAGKASEGAGMDAEAAGAQNRRLRDSHTGMMDNMDKVMRLLRATGKECHFYDQVTLKNPPTSI